jgi:hypothetical protein
MLLTVMAPPLDGDDLRDLIMLDERDHFYIAGLSFWPPKDKLAAEFARAGTTPVEFSLFKPDLLEIIREEDGFITWRVIDAKASKGIKVKCLMVVLEVTFINARFFRRRIKSRSFGIHFV